MPWPSFTPIAHTAPVASDQDQGARLKVLSSNSSQPCARPSAGDDLREPKSVSDRVDAPSTVNSRGFSQTVEL